MSRFPSAHAENNHPAKLDAAIAFREVASDLE
jgi:hypothetical protein